MSFDKRLSVSVELCYINFQDNGMWSSTGLIIQSAYETVAKGAW